MSSDLSRRYVSDHYAGRKVFREIYDVVTTLARQVFRARYVDIRPIVGHITVLASIMAFLRPGDTIMTIDPAHGGYPITMAGWAGIRKVFHPFDPETHNIKITDAQELMRRSGPKLVILGGSRILFPYPVAEIVQTAHEIGATVYFDGSHVMGLIVGDHFQQPLAEGADVLGGSTHKALCGPQRGIITTNSEDLNKRVDAVLGDSVMLQNNYHPASLAALGIALAEMKQFGTAYAAQVVTNAQVLARALCKEGVPVLAARFGYTRSHQVILDVDSMPGLTAGDVTRRLEDGGIIGGTRLGTQEVTRLGMKGSEMEQVAPSSLMLCFRKGPLPQYAATFATWLRFSRASTTASKTAKRHTVSSGRLFSTACSTRILPDVNNWRHPARRISEYLTANRSLCENLPRRRQAGCASEA